MVGYGGQTRERYCRHVQVALRRDTEFVVGQIGPGIAETNREMSANRSIFKKKNFFFFSIFFFFFKQKTAYEISA